ncbi:MAG TPA: substrate-binding domain-containing protein [Rhodoferax sp.]
MHRLQLHYTLSRDASPAQVRNPLIDLLQAVSSQGSISGGARALGLSYRHVWGELKRWENELGSELLVWEKGQSARLTGFGNKLMWAERQAQARLAPQIEALRAELERTFALAFDDQVQVLTVYASHDEAIAQLREVALSQPHEATRLHLDVRFTGSVDAIRALNEGRCVMAGFHTLEPAARRTRSERTYKPLLRPGQHKIIGFAKRTLGLMVAPGNPLMLHSLHDVASQGARFANRALGSGTRLLLDELLDRSGLSAQDINGYSQAEPSHASVAQAVASGHCDTGLGIAAAARQAGLDFVPLQDERYHLVCLKSALAHPSVQKLLLLLQTAQWQTSVARIVGYAPAQSGQVLSMRKVLPWWDFAQAKTRTTPT